MSACMRRGTVGTHPRIHTLIWARIHTFPVPRVMSSKPSVTSSKTEFLSVSPSRVCEALAEVTSDVIRGRHSSRAVRGPSEAIRGHPEGPSESIRGNQRPSRGTIRVRTCSIETSLTESPRRNEPPSGCSSPLSIFIRVVLPAPDEARTQRHQRHSQHSPSPAHASEWATHKGFVSRIRVA